MDNAIFRFPKPANEPVKAYAPGSAEKASLKKALEQLSAEEWLSKKNTALFMNNFKDKK